MLNQKIQKKINRSNKYLLKTNNDNSIINTNNNYKEIVGMIDFNLSGNAYLVSNLLKKDIFISSKNTLNSLPNDTVLVKYLDSNSLKRLEGRVIKVIKRFKKRFVGTFKIKKKKYGFVVIDNNKFHIDFFISHNSINGANNGDIVLIEFIKWKKNSIAPKALIIKVLGKPENNETEIQAILYNNEISMIFPKEVELEVKTINTKINHKEISERKDMRSICTFTIDPLNAQDLDDALSVQKLSNGNYEVGVHISDVSYYIKPYSSIDNEAYKRANSIYLVDRIIPMFPEILSNNILSLLPNQDKFTFSAIFELDENASIKNQWFGKTIIQSKKQFTYEEVQKIIDEENGEFKENILILNKLAKKIRNKRIKEGAINFNKIEIKFNLNENKDPTSVYFKIPNDSNYLIEEFMLLTNKKISEFISVNKKNSLSKKTYIYRIHDKPNFDKLFNLKEFIQTFGYKLSLQDKKTTALSINNLLIQIKGKNEEEMIKTLTMRIMSKAKYSTKNIGHYGLAFDYYTHFTSPIRRYTDIIAHRLFQHYLLGGKSVKSNIIEKKAEHCSYKERLTNDIERQVIKYMQIKFMKSREGKYFEGIISGVTEWGIYVEIIENHCEGFIPLKNMNGDKYYFNEKTYSIIGKKSKYIYQLGNLIKIQVLKANLRKRQIEFKIIN